jgi:hypothetical protein
VQAVDDAGHDKAGRLKVRLLEAVDRMVGQLARRLWEAEREGVARYTLMVTGDHSTPVDYGDHSYEPVPLLACQLADFVERRYGGLDPAMWAGLRVAEVSASLALTAPFLELTLHRSI